jgi:16S rRNA (guanine(966)-N(2))-methyltransferase RsmD
MSLRLSGGRRLQSPHGDSARPTPSRVRLAVMNRLALRLPGCRWLDLCTGSGVMACEALQRGARSVVAVEHDRRNAAVARANLQAVLEGLARPAEIVVHCAEVKRWLHRPRQDPGQRPGNELEPFDVIYADPPYSSGLYEAIATEVHRGGWLAEGGRLILECASAARPALPESWHLEDERRYGTTTVLFLVGEAAQPDG